MSDIKKTIRNAAKNLKDKIKNDQQVREGASLVFNALLTIALRAMQRR